jgi:hypothetical protein
MMSVIAWFAALVAVLTALAMLQDAQPYPDQRTTRAWIRHVLRLALLVGITAAAGLELVHPSKTTMWQTVLRCCLVGFMAMQAPCPWFRYVFKGNASTNVDHRRWSA